MKKIMLQGYLQEPNFGDVLFGHLFYSRCKELGFENVDFFQFKNLGIGEHCRKEYHYFAKKTVLQCLRADALVIISGGSLWDDGRSKTNAKIRFQRYILPARLYQLMGKPVYFLGVGGGPVETPWLRKQMIKSLNKAKVIQFRDRVTKSLFEDYQVNNQMTVTVDTALVINQKMLESLEEKEKLDLIAAGRKKLLLHLPDGSVENEKLATKIVPALVRFCEEHPEYIVVISHDNIRKLGEKEQEAIQSEKRQLDDAGIVVYHYRYHDSWQMCSLINEMDCIITAKLHVGVIGCALDKCVISFPVAREKTKNFYAMIDESERCIYIDQVTPEDAFLHICRFHDKPVHISHEMRELAGKNLDILDVIRNN